MMCIWLVLRGQIIVEVLVARLLMFCTSLLLFLRVMDLTLSTMHINLCSIMLFVVVDCVALVERVRANVL